MPARNSQPSAESVLARFLTHSHSNSAETLEDLCREHPQLASRLRELYSDLAQFQDLLDNAHASPGPDLSETLTRGAKVGPYTLEERLGRGAMGEVWSARDVNGAEFALKLMHPQLTRNARAVMRFHREARAGLQLRHPNIVCVHATGFFHARPYIVQELVAGGRSLADVVQAASNGRRLPRRHYLNVARWTRAICVALQHAHEVGVVHRDIKPHNILLAENDEPLLADFGLVLVQDDFTVSQSGDVLGTAAYMSPEQVESRFDEIDARSDVFSVGAMLYELLTLQRPFDSNGLFETMRAIVERDPAPPTSLRPECPRELERICLRALARRPQERFQSAQEFAMALGAFESRFQRRRGAGAVMRDLVRLRPQAFREVLESVDSAIPTTRAKLLTGVSLAVLVSGVFVIRRVLQPAPIHAESTVAALPLQASTPAPASTQSGPLADEKTPDAPSPLSVDPGAAERQAVSSARILRAANRELVSQWAEILDEHVDPKVVTDADFLQRIEATALPWRVRDRVSRIELLLVPPGEYRRGASDDDPLAQPDERPAHRVRISRAFYLGRYETTISEFRAVTGRRWSPNYLDEDPAMGITRAEVLEFLARCPGLRLPTEAEWEYACRAGTLGPHYADVDWAAWRPSNARGVVHPVGRRGANALGFQDMLGNVWEYCSDLYHPQCYEKCGDFATDPTGPRSGTLYVIRGGSYNTNFRDSCRASARGTSAMEEKFGTRGFRVARWP